MRVIVIGVLCLGVSAFSKTSEKYQNKACTDQSFSITEIQSRQKKSQFLNENLTQWFHSEKPLGIVLMVHGVSMQASGMNPLVRELSEYDVLRVTLYGHGGSKIQKKASREEWVNDLFESYCLARARATELNLPLFFVSYSLGALVNMDLMSSDYKERIEYNALAMLAPAISLHKKVESLHQIWWLGFVVMPKARVRMFHALLDTYRHLQKRPWTTTAPAVIYLDPQDELVSIKKLRGRLENAPNWSLIEVSNRGHEEKREHHYIIYPPALGKEEWGRMTSGVREFLANFH